MSRNQTCAEAWSNHILNECKADINVREKKKKISSKKSEQRFSRAWLITGNWSSAQAGVEIWGNPRTTLPDEILVDCHSLSGLMDWKRGTERIWNSQQIASRSGVSLAVCEDAKQQQGIIRVVRRCAFLLLCHSIALHPGEENWE